MCAAEVESGVQTAAAESGKADGLLRSKGGLLAYAQRKNTHLRLGSEHRARHWAS